MGADGSREADFINIVVWGKTAENCAQYLAKGKLAAVDGRLQVRHYEGKDGQRRYVTEVVADNVRFLSPKSEGGQSDEPETWVEDSEYAGGGYTSTEDLPF